MGQIYDIKRIGEESNQKLLPVIPGKVKVELTLRYIMIYSIDN